MDLDFYNETKSLDKCVNVSVSSNKHNILGVNMLHSNYIRHSLLLHILFLKFESISQNPYILGATLTVCKTTHCRANGHREDEH